MKAETEKEKEMLKVIERIFDLTHEMVDWNESKKEIKRLTANIIFDENN